MVAPYLPTACIPHKPQLSVICESRCGLKWTCLLEASDLDENQCVFIETPVGKTLSRKWAWGWMCTWGPNKAQQGHKHKCFDFRKTNLMSARCFEAAGTLNIGKFVHVMIVHYWTSYPTRSCQHTDRQAECKSAMVWSQFVSSPTLLGRHQDAINVLTADGVAHEVPDLPVCCHHVSLFCVWLQRMWHLHFPGLLLSLFPLLRGPKGSVEGKGKVQSVKHYLIKQKWNAM